MFKQIYRCRHCGQKGHNVRTCPTLVHQQPRSTDQPIEPPKPVKPRTCSFCGYTGHNKTTCVLSAELKSQIVSINQEFRTKVLKYFNELGYGIGALVKAHPAIYREKPIKFVYGIITHINWSNITLYWLGGHKLEQIIKGVQHYRNHLVKFNNKETFRHSKHRIFKIKWFKEQPNEYWSIYKCSSRERWLGTPHYKHTGTSDEYIEMFYNMTVGAPGYLNKTTDRMSYYEIVAPAPEPMTPTRGWLKGYDPGVDMLLRRMWDSQSRY